MGASKNAALLIIDVQNDFLPGGNLAVNDGHAIVPVINNLMAKLKNTAFDVVVASKDWHPTGHASFASTHGVPPFSVKDLDGYPQTMWPDHCVQETVGADLSQELDAKLIDEVVFKGTNKDIDSYSAFFDNRHLTDLGLSKMLKDKGINKVYLVGLATDFCVRFSAEDAIGEGFETTVIVDATRGIDDPKGNIQAALDSLKAKGVELVTASELLASHGVAVA
eukprot:jgi/Botrbrau1/16985/Bobra.49_2s0044.1